MNKTPKIGSGCDSCLGVTRLASQRWHPRRRDSGLVVNLVRCRSKSVGVDHFFDNRRQIEGVGFSRNPENVSPTTRLPKREPSGIDEEWMRCLRCVEHEKKKQRNAKGQK